MNTDYIIQPIYVIDTHRASTLIEIRTQSILREMIMAHFTGSTERLLPHHFYSIHDIHPQREITDAYQRLKKRSHLGSQYDWLSRLAYQESIPKLELSVQAGGRPYGFIKDYVVKTVDVQGVANFRLGENVSDPDLKTIFGPFRFPVLNLSKLQMREWARSTGVIHIMMQTWFCFSPRQGVPCGICNPCKYAIEQGMACRFSRRALIRGKLYSLLRFPRLVMRRVMRRKL